MLVSLSNEFGFVDLGCVTIAAIIVHSSVPFRNQSTTVISIGLTFVLCGGISHKDKNTNVESSSRKERERERERERENLDKMT